MSHTTAAHCIDLATRARSAQRDFAAARAQRRTQALQRLAQLLDERRDAVLAANAADVAAATSKSLALGGVTFREVLETLHVMYPQAARLAAERLADADISELRAAHQAFRDSPSRNAADTVERAVAFFQNLAGRLDNRVMLAMLQSLNMMIGASLALVIGETPRAKVRIEEAQAEIIAALEASDEEKAAAWMSRHIDDLMRGYQVANVDLDARIL